MEKMLREYGESARLLEGRIRELCGADRGRPLGADTAARVARLEKELKELRMAAGAIEEYLEEIHRREEEGK